MAAGKWLRLDRNYLARPEFREIIATPEGIAYALIYASLLVAYGEYMPCDKDVLATRLHFEAPKVQEALNAFYRKKLVGVVDSKPNGRFQRPTLEEVTAYCKERNRGVNPERFFDHYEAVGWKIGSTPIEDWRAAARKWEKEDAPKETGGDKYGAKKYNVDSDYLEYLKSLEGRI